MARDQRREDDLDDLAGFDASIRALVHDQELLLVGQTGGHDHAAAELELLQERRRQQFSRDLEPGMRVSWLQAEVPKLVRHSDEVLEALLIMADREDILAGKLLVDARDKLVEMLEIIDQLHAGDSAADPTND